MWPFHSLCKSPNGTTSTFRIVWVEPFTANYKRVSWGIEERFNVRLGDKKYLLPSFHVNEMNSKFINYGSLQAWEGRKSGHLCLRKLGKRIIFFKQRLRVFYLKIEKAYTFICQNKELMGDWRHLVDGSSLLHLLFFILFIFPWLRFFDWLLLSLHVLLMLKWCCKWIFPVHRRVLLPVAWSHRTRIL